MAAHNLTHYLADAPPTVVPLEIEKHFNALDDQQKRYAHFISRYERKPKLKSACLLTKPNSASFLGNRIILRQVSPESEPIYDFILALYKSCDGNWKALQLKSGVSDEGLTQFLEYAAQFLGNTGNYKSFGDAKFIPRCPESVVAALASTSLDAETSYKATKGGIFSSDQPGMLHLGYPDKGHMTTYYPESPDITQNEIEAITAWMAKQGLLPENTRLRKRGGAYQILIASAVAPEEGDIGRKTEYIVQDGPLANKLIELIYGDYSDEMKAISRAIKGAAENASNENQRQMHEAYAKSFEKGSLKAFKDSQKFWIMDKKPMIESNIGFIETYRDPAGIRGEWEGFAAMVNSKKVSFIPFWENNAPKLALLTSIFLVERTRAFGQLVDNAEKLIPLLPWSKDFEKDKFLSPDFTSLEVLTFAGMYDPA